ncbi:nucleotidyl transferase AbiEii/AbiGii toxin family protein [Candidatus Sumerlaeota bacterium]|nr:nucleotidyl transferase AbiEii/AbiGii toxin family protein [Candidatus Sumerlaeota bacterium]
MPLTEPQKRILKILASRRSPENYLAGATVLHRAEDSPRFSEDIDFFHDIADSIAQSAETDASTLKHFGIDLEWLLRTPTFYRAVAIVSGEKLKLEWAVDSTFRFFPVVEDSLCGFRLHETDAAVNKILDLAGRREARDFVDILYIHKTRLSIGALAWAACGKDPGYSPAFLLDHAGQHVAYAQDDIDRLSLNEKMNIYDLKREWLTALERSYELINSLPASDIGCLYLTPEGTPITPDPESPDFKGLARHFGSVRGAWPSISPFMDHGSGKPS